MRINNLNDIQAGLSYFPFQAKFRFANIGSFHNIQDLSSQLIAFLPFTCARPLSPGFAVWRMRCSGVINTISRTSCGLGPTTDIVPPDVKIETTFFQRKFFSTTPYNYPQKQHKKRTSDLSEVPILRLFLKILPPSAPLPASYQIPPDCTLNGIFQSSDTFFLYPSRMFSISFSALAHC